MYLRSTPNIAAEKSATQPDIVSDGLCLTSDLSLLAVWMLFGIDAHIFAVLVCQGSSRC